MNALAAPIYSAIPEDPPPKLVIRAYEVRGDSLLLSIAPAPTFFSPYTGTNISLPEWVKAATDLQQAFLSGGYSNVCVAIAPDQITNGVVTLNVVRGGLAQVLVSGRRYYVSDDGMVSTTPAITASALTDAAGAGSATNPPAAPKYTGPRFDVRAYEIHGDTLLTTDTLKAIFVKYTGTNIGIPEILKAGQELQLEYRTRGFPTVNVTIPPQQITNNIVKIRVFQGQLSQIKAVGNRYFSFPNIMRALPSLKTNTYLSEPIFQAELDRANANQDRQIYPKLGPGMKTNTTELVLIVKDRLPLHGKVELNNQNSPGTPELRINSSAAYNNLWQHEHSLGLQYSFSPQASKEGGNWTAFDRPLVANYSAFYRFPIGTAGAVSDVVATKPGAFGYDEATRKFNLPASSGRPEINVYASRSTIDTGVLSLSERVILNNPGVISISAKDVQQDLTVNNSVGTRLSLPSKATANFQSSFSGGVDYKTYELSSYKTNNFIFSIITRDPGGNLNPPITSTVASPNPPPDGKTVKELEYLPLALRYDASLRDGYGVTAFGLGLSGNVWHSGDASDLQNITGSKESKGHWIILTPSLSRDFNFYTNWNLSLRAEGQWASEPLISNEQFGAGGVGNVRGYSEGEVFGDTGWRVNMEIRTPPHVVGIAYGKEALTLRGSVFMDYAETYLLDPQGRDGHVPLWGCGFGGVISLGSHWDGRFIFSWPLLATPNSDQGQPRFNFALTGQF